METNRIWVGFCYHLVYSYHSGMTYSAWVVPQHLDANAIGQLSSPAGKAPENPTPMLCRAGTAVVFDTRIRHTGMANTSEVRRDSIFFSYVPFWCKRVTALESAVRCMDESGMLLEPLERQVLGLELPGSIHWEPRQDLVDTAAKPPSPPPFPRL